MLGLRYVTDQSQGIRRLTWGKAFRYLGPDQKSVQDEETLKRIKSLVIPPAWTGVWICPAPSGHIQAIGRDARGRKQYRYHPLYRQLRDQAKFGRMMAFGAVLALIRRRVAEDLNRPGVPREKVLATVVRLLETTCIRVGNMEYAKDNESFGLTTMRNRHVKIEGATLHFEFRGKSGLKHAIELTDRKLAHIVKRCQDIPGYELFQYLDQDGATCRVDSADVNAYIREIAGEEFTAKDFRTWAGTVLAARELHEVGPCRSAADGKRKIVTALKRVSGQLGNRLATCRKYYVHPAILEAYSNTKLFEAIHQGAEEEQAYNGQGLSREEYAVMVLIAQYTEDMMKSKKAA